MRIGVVCVFGALAIQGTAAAQSHDLNEWSSVIGNLATVCTVAWTAGIWLRKQQQEMAQRRADERAKLAAEQRQREDEIEVKRKLYEQMLAVYRQLAPEGQPSIMQRVGELESSFRQMQGEMGEQTTTLGTQNVQLGRIEKLAGGDGDPPGTTNRQDE